MKKLILPVLFAFIVPSFFSCSALKGYRLNEADAAAAIRQMLELGARDGVYSNAFSKETILTTLFPEPVAKALNTLNQLGLTSEVDRFTTTLSTAAQKTAVNSIPIFVSGINRMSFTDAIHIIRNGGTSATDYLRARVGSDLRQSITPVMKDALNEYKLYDQWEKIIKPVENLLGNKINLDLANLMAGVVSEAMFRQLEEKEIQVRNNPSARTTKLLQKVFKGDQ